MPVPPRYGIFLAKTCSNWPQRTLSAGSWGQSPHVDGRLEKWARQGVRERTDDLLREPSGGVFTSEDGFAFSSLLCLMIAIISFCTYNVNDCDEPFCTLWSDHRVTPADCSHEEVGFTHYFRDIASEDLSSTRLPKIGFSHYEKFAYIIILNIQYLYTIYSTVGLHIPIIMS